MSERSTASEGQTQRQGGASQDSIATRAAQVASAPTPGSMPGSAADFEPLSELGRGGMATVELAYQRSLGREVAIKRQNADVPGGQALLLQEAMVTGQLEHPNIVPVHGLVREGEFHAVVMKRVAGRSWEDLLLAEGEDGVSQERHIDILTQVCNGIAFAHSRGFVHLDIKPANVMVGDFGEVYVMDWGLARRASEGSATGALGTPTYMPPELVHGQFTFQTDVFLLGATLHEVLVGRPPNSGQTAEEAMARAALCLPPEFDSEVPPELAELCRRALARDPADRVESVAELRSSLVTYREHLGSTRLARAAEQRHLRLSELVESGGSDAAVQRAFLEARLTYEQALQAWPENVDAQRGLHGSVVCMAQRELAAGHPDAAKALLQSLPAPPPELAESVAVASRGAATAQKRLQQFERDADPAEGAMGRLRALLVFALPIAVMTLVLTWSRLGRPGFVPSTERLAGISAVVLGAMILAAAWWWNHGWNRLNRHIALLCLFTLSASFLLRFAASHGGWESAHVLLADAFLIGLGGLALSLVHRAGYAVAAVAFAVAVIGAVWPAWIDDVFIAATIGAPLMLLAARLGGARYTLPAGSSISS